MDYNKVLSEKVKKITPSKIRKFFDIASTIDDVISLSIGEPDFHTPWSVRKTAISSLERGRTRYTSNAGTIELRRAISDYLIKRIGIEYNPDKEILVTVGGSEAIDLGIRALINPGDEVLVVEPSFVCYSPIVNLVGGVPVTIETKFEDEFRLTAAALREKVTDKTKLLILPFPNNPTGAIMERHHLEEIAEVLRGTNIMILSDEIYSELTYGAKHVSIAQIEGMKERTIVINGFSKAFAMTGWRLGYATGPAPIISEMMKIHQYAIMCSPTISQHAAVTALTSCDEDVTHMVNEYDMRRKFLLNSFKSLGLECFEPKGAFYVFPSIKSSGLDSDTFCERLLYEQKVAVVPGNAFGSCGEGFVRISYAYSLNHLKTAVKRMEQFLAKL
ncbi:MAG TPA: aminotransferase class I/II-fold pyridoxal phosphate-dependent enzyme [Oscillospiraceae bacterium]|nr:aminotransferase class I/II-fold pyridoxal phosphate-dependent enzyme [Oscillospiraceae bacterium]